MKTPRLRLMAAAFASLAALLLSAAISGLLPTASRAQENAQIRIRGETLGPQTLILAIVAEGVADLGGFQFNLAVDPAVARIETAQLGALLSATGRQATTLGPLLSDQAGALDFGGYSYDPTGANGPGPHGDGSLAQVTMTVTGEGASDLTLSGLLLTDVNANVEAAMVDHAAIQVKRLHPGWNLIAPCVDSTGMAVADALQSIDGAYDMVLGETGTYVTGLPPEFQSLHDLAPPQSYYVRVQGGETVTLTLLAGTHDPQAPIPLTRGWRWLGYCGRDATPVAAALQSIDGAYDMVLGETGTYVVGLPDAFQSLRELQPGAGYLIRMTEDVTLIFPATAAHLPQAASSRMEKGAAPRGTTGIARPATETIILQNGVSPDPSYHGAVDAAITNWGGNSYANLGGWDHLQIGEAGDGDQFRALIRFDLDGQLPAHRRVRAAWLELYAYDGDYDDAAQDAIVHQVDEAWIEGDGWDLGADARAEGVTWATARPGVSWTHPGGDFDPAELDRVTAAANPDGWLRWDVTEAVRGWVAGATPNNGLLIEPDAAPWAHHLFHATEYGDPGLRPRLIIELEPGMTGDLDGDGDVDEEDIHLVASAWPATEGDPGFHPDYDLDGDAAITIIDIMRVASHWGETRPSPTPSPTPTSSPAPTPGPTLTPTPTPTPTSTPTPAFTPTATPTPTVTPTPAPPKPLDVRLRVRDRAGAARRGDPVTWGVPLPRAAHITDPGQLRLLDADGRAIPAQFTPLARWAAAPDDATKPIKWVLLDFQADVEAGGEAVYRLTHSSPDPAPIPQPIQIEEGGDGMVIDVGAARFHLSRSGFGLFQQIELDRDGDAAVDDPLLAGPGEIVAMADGVAYRSDADAVSEMVVELPGDLHAVVRVKGHLRSEKGDKLLAYTARLHFYAGKPAARLLFGVWNDNPMVNDGTGQPDIKAFGSPNTVLFDDLTLRLQLASGTNPDYVLAGGPGETWRGPLTDSALLYQDSSGGPQWNHAPDHADANFRGFAAQADNVTLHAACTESDAEEDCRSEGWAGLQSAGGGVVAGVRHFWQNYPKAMALRADGTVEVRLFPADAGRAYELRVGEQKTHEIAFYFGTEDATTAMTGWLHPLQALAPAAYYLEEAAVFDRAVPRDPTVFPDFEGYVDATILYPDMNVFILRDGAADANWVYAPRPESWGWRNFGDTIAEDETGGDTYPVFTNQQYDHPWVAILQMVRALDASDDRSDLWWRIAESGARHQADIDIIHSLCTGWPPDAMQACMDATQGPPYITGWAMGGRLTNQHHADPSPNLHRHALIDHWSGGIRGLLTAYYLTGDATLRDAWLELAENVRWRVDNSPCDPDCGPGYANNNPGEGDARGPAYALEILTDAYAATGDPAYLASARAAVAASHPDNAWFGQPGFVPDPNLSPSGRQTGPWGLAMIMKSLGRYLDMTMEWDGAPDPAARDSLLRYAELLTDWWRLGTDEPSCYYIGENGGCSPQAQNYFLADGLAWALSYDDGRADRARWEAVAAEAWRKSESEPWGPTYPKGAFLTTKTHFMLANNGVAWMDYALTRGLVP